MPYLTVGGTLRNGTFCLNVGFPQNKRNVVHSYVERRTANEEKHDDLKSIRMIHRSCHSFITLTGLFTYAGVSCSLSKAAAARSQASFAIPQLV